MNSTEFHVSTDIEIKIPWLLFGSSPKTISEICECL